MKTKHLTLLFFFPLLLLTQSSNGQVIEVITTGVKVLGLATQAKDAIIKLFGGGNDNSLEIEIRNNQHQIISKLDEIIKGQQRIEMKTDTVISILNTFPTQLNEQHLKECYTGLNDIIQNYNIGYDDGYRQKFANRNSTYDNYTYFLSYVLENEARLEYMPSVRAYLEFLTAVFYNRKDITSIYLGKASKYIMPKVLEARTAQNVLFSNFLSDFLNAQKSPQITSGCFRGSITTKLSNYDKAISDSLTLRSLFIKDLTNDISLVSANGLNFTCTVGCGVDGCGNLGEAIRIDRDKNAKIILRNMYNTSYKSEQDFLVTAAIKLYVLDILYKSFEKLNPTPTRIVFDRKKIKN